MDAMLRLVNAPDEEKKEKGTEYTPAEIYQQPQMWLETLSILDRQKDEILQQWPREGIYLTEGSPVLLFVGR